MLNNGAVSDHRHIQSEPLSETQIAQTLGRRFHIQDLSLKEMRPNPWCVIAWTESRVGYAIVFDRIR
jgi:hypothetical protein